MTAARTTCAADACRAAATTAGGAAALRVINAEQAHNHPMRNYVECCLGGDPILPEMTITRRRRIEPNDVLLVCTDGLWGSLKDEEIAEIGTAGGLREKLLKLGERAVKRAGSAGDNTSAAALRWLGD